MAYASSRRKRRSADDRVANAHWMHAFRAIHTGESHASACSLKRQPGAVSMVTRLDGIETADRALLTKARRKANVFDGHDHLLHTDLVRFIAYHGLLLRKARLCLFHTWQPFQGLLDQQRSGRSRHALHVQDDLFESSGRLLRERHDL